MNLKKAAYDLQALVIAWLQSHRYESIDEIRQEAWAVNVVRNWGLATDDVSWCVANACKQELRNRVLH